MGYVELLRVRNIFRIYGSILVAIVAIVVVSTLWAMHFGHDAGASSGRVRISISGESGMSDRTSGDTRVAGSLSALDFTVPLGIVFGIAAYAAIIFATLIGPSLNKENDGSGFSFTKPVSRERLALEYFSIDLAAIVGVFAFTVVLALLALACVGILAKLRVDPHAAQIAACGLGAAFMWYGLLQALSSWNHAKGGIFIALSWVSVAFLAPMTYAAFGTPFQPLVVALDYLSPLAYFSGVTMSGAKNVVTMQSLLGIPVAADIALTWSIGLAACALATYGWKRVEV